MKTKEILASYCKIIKGYNRSLVSNLLTSNWWALDNEYMSYIHNQDFENLKLIFPEVYELLISNDLILTIPIEDEEKFIPFNTDYKFPGNVQNAIIDWEGGISNYSIAQTIKQLEINGCQNVAFRFYNHFNLELFNELINALEFSTIEGVEIALPYDYYQLNMIFFLDAKSRCPRIINILLHGSPEKIDGLIRDDKKLMCTKEKIVDCTSCGKISPLYFTLNINHFTLSQHYNNCLYQKIGIDINGNYKNCPSSNHVLGNVADDKLSDILIQPDYNLLTRIKKDQVAICKDCEFRDICSDCRVYVTDDIYSKPQKCSYDPYKNTW